MNQDHAQKHTDDLRGVIQTLQAEIIEYRRSEEALRVSEARLQAAIDAANIGLWEWNLVSGEIIWLGHSERLFGFAPGEFDGTYPNFENRIHPEDLEGFNRIIQRAREEGSEYAHEYRVIWPDGSIHWIAGRGRFIYNDAGQAVRMYGAVLDITERERAEEALRESEKQLSLIYNSTTDYIVLIRVDGKDNYNIESCNEAYLRANREAGINITSGQLAGMSVRHFMEEFVQSDQAKIDFIFEKYQEAVTTRKILQYDEETRLDGVIVYHETTLIPILDTTGQCTNLLYVSRDITERKRAEDALRRSEDQLRRVIDTIPTMAWTAQPDGTVDFLNERWTDYSGISLEQYVQDPAGPIHPEDISSVFEKWWAHMAAGEPHEDEMRIRGADGQYRWFLVRTAPLRDESGKIVKWYGVSTDVDDRKRAEEEIRRHAGRMEAVAEISRTFVEAGLDYQRVLSTVVQRTAELIGDACVMTLFSDDGQRSYPVAFYHRDPKALAMMHGALMHRTDTRRYQTLLSGNSIYLPEVNPEEFRASLEPELRELFDAVGISSFIIVPLRIQGRVIGALGIFRDRHDSSYTRDDLVLLQNLSDRAALTIQNARLFEQVQGARQRLQTLSRQLLVAQEEERRAVARELHDEIGQTLTGLVMHLGMAKSLLPKSAGPVRNILEQSEALIQDILERARAIIAGLRPQVLDDLGLVPALRRFGEEFQEKSGVTVKIKTDHLTQRLPAPIEVALFRIVQEALTNVHKHAQAHQVNIALRREDEQIVLSVQDDGIGFEQRATRSSANGDMLLEGGWTIPYDHFGLLGIQERAVQLGGRLQITSALGQGMTLRVELPLSEAKEVSNERI